jgi:hypothetical protein
MRGGFMDPVEFRKKVTGTLGADRMLYFNFIIICNKMPPSIRAVPHLVTVYAFFHGIAPFTYHRMVQSGFSCVEKGQFLVDDFF